MNIKELAVSVNKLKLEVEKEGLQREEIKLSDEYEAIDKKVADLREEQKKMLEGVPDSSQNLQDVSDSMFDLMTQTDTEKHGNIELKYKTKKEVNIDRAKGLMGDDLMAYVKVTQKELKSYADQFKEQNPDYAKDVMKCVEVVSKEAVSINIK